MAVFSLFLPFTSIYRCSLFSVLVNIYEEYRFSMRHFALYLVNK